MGIEKFKQDKYSKKEAGVTDPLGQIYNPASSDHYSHLKVVMFCEFRKVRMNVWTDVWTDTTQENSDHYRPYRPWINNSLIIT